MEISSLKHDSKNVEIKAKVKKWLETKYFMTSTGKKMLTKFIVKDDTAEAVLVVFGDVGKIIMQGQVILIKNAFIRQYSDRELKYNKQLELIVNEYSTVNVLSV